MTPTNELRFVERLVSADVHPDKIIRILQQKWEDTVIVVTPAMNEIRQSVFEWRDVPCVKETV